MRWRQCNALWNDVKQIVQFSCTAINGPLHCHTSRTNHSCCVINAIAGPPRLLTSVRPSTVRCSSHSHISKTKQDRVLVTMEHYEEDGIGDSVQIFHQTPPVRRYSGFKICANCTRPLIRLWRQIISCCQPSTTWRQTTAVVNRARPSSQHWCSLLSRSQWRIWGLWRANRKPDRPRVGLACWGSYFLIDRPAFTSY